MIALLYDNATQLSDLSRDGGNILTDEGLETAAFISLFTRRAALPDDVLPEPQAPRGGWWADPYADVEGDLIGSRLWLLSRSKASQATVNLARLYAEEAVQWMVEDGIAESVTAEAERHADGVLAFRVEIVKPTEPASRWSGVWTAHLNSL